MFLLILDVVMGITHMHKKYYFTALISVILIYPFSNQGIIPNGKYNKFLLLGSDFHQHLEHVAKQASLKNGH